MSGPFIVSKWGEHAYAYRPGDELEAERHVPDELDVGLGEAFARRLAAQYEVVHVGQVVHEELVAPGDQTVDVLARRIAEVDREAGPDRADKTGNVARRRSRRGAPTGEG